MLLSSEHGLIESVPCAAGLPQTRGDSDALDPPPLHCSWRLPTRRLDTSEGLASCPLPLREVTQLSTDLKLISLRLLSFEVVTVSNLHLC